MHKLSTHFVLGYHGCFREQGEKLLANDPFKISTNDYDWLGSGAYFWESDPERAIDWAIEQCIRQNISTDNAFVVGAVLDLGYCLDMTTIKAANLFKDIYTLVEFEIGKDKLPKNSGGSNRLLRRLDCLIFERLHSKMKENEHPPFDSVRGIFFEGPELFPDAGFHEKTHVQICVRNLNLIKGVFRVNMGGWDVYIKKQALLRNKTAL